MSSSRPVTSAAPLASTEAQPKVSNAPLMPSRALKPCKFDVFLSYAPSDRHLAHALFLGLRWHGFSVWLDEVESDGEATQAATEGIKCSRVIVPICTTGYFARGCRASGQLVEMLKKVWNGNLPAHFDGFVVPVVHRECHLHKAGDKVSIDNPFPAERPLKGRLGSLVEQTVAEGCTFPDRRSVPVELVIRLAHLVQEHMGRPMGKLPVPDPLVLEKDILGGAALLRGLPAAADRREQLIRLVGIIADGSTGGHDPSSPPLPGSRYLPERDVAILASSSNVSELKHYVHRQIDRRNFKDAATILERLIQVYKLDVGEDDPSLASDLFRLGTLHHQANNMAAALKALKESLLLDLEAHGDEPHEDVAASRYQIARVYKDMDFIEDGVEFCLASIREYNALLETRETHEVQTGLSRARRLLVEFQDRRQELCRAPVRVYKPRALTPPPSPPPPEADRDGSPPPPIPPRSSSSGSSASSPPLPPRAPHTASRHTLL